LLRPLNLEKYYGKIKAMKPFYFCVKKPDNKPTYSQIDIYMK